MRVKCLTQEHNTTMSPAGARTRTAQSPVKRANHEANGSNNTFYICACAKIFGNTLILLSIIGFKNICEAYTEAFRCKTKINRDLVSLSSRTYHWPNVYRLRVLVGSLCVLFAVACHRNCYGFGYEAL